MPDAAHAPQLERPAGDRRVERVEAALGGEVAGGDEQAGRPSTGRRRAPERSPPPPCTSTTAARLCDGRYQPEKSQPVVGRKVTCRKAALGGAPTGSRKLCVERPPPPGQHDARRAGARDARQRSIGPPPSAAGRPLAAMAERDPDPERHQATPVSAARTPVMSPRAGASTAMWSTCRAPLVSASTPSLMRSPAGHRTPVRTRGKATTATAAAASITSPGASRCRPGSPGWRCTNASSRRRARRRPRSPP